MTDREVRRFTEEEMDQPFCGVEKCSCPTPNQIHKLTGRPIRTYYDAVANLPYPDLKKEEEKHGR